MKRTLVLLALLASMFAFNAKSSQATVIVNFDPVGTYADVGSTFNVNILANVSANEALVGWGFNLLYDTTQLNLNSTSTSPYWDLLPPLTGDINNLTALLSPSLTSPDPGLSGADLLLATLSFTCLGPGTSPLGISIDLLDPAQGFMTFDGLYAEWQVNPATIEQETPGHGTSPVPEPATMLLFGTGIAGLAGIARRKS